jgi:hypothetical protein
MSTSRWLTWSPSNPIFESVHDYAPPKPSKVSSGGFAGSLSGHSSSMPSPVRLWFEARCAQRDGIWGAEKFLWRDYKAWSEQRRQTLCSRQLFCHALNGSFTRESDGWLGIVLADDVVASS